LEIKSSKLFSYDLVANPAFYNYTFKMIFDREEERKKLKNDRTEKLNRLNNL